MRQVPHYLIIGNGCMASHMRCYFKQQSLSFVQWYRSAHSIEQLQDLIDKASHVLLLISDSAIEPFVEKYLKQYNHIRCIHFSGNLNTQYAYSAHPLCTFIKNKLYSVEKYKSIPFVLNENSPCFQQLLPGLANPSYKIKAKDRPYYHAMCVLANNFSVILWQKFFKEMESRFLINTSDLMPFVEKTFGNIKSYPHIEHTGPLIRNDVATLQSDLSELEKDSFYTIFKAFIDTFTQEAQHEEST